MIRPAIPPADLAPELRRRGLLKGGLSVAALTLLSGCDLSTDSGIDALLKAALRFDDRVQAWLFNPTRLAKTFPASRITHPFRFNAYYPEWQVRTVDPAAWRLELAGRIETKTPWTLAALRTLPQEEQITRHVCVEGWSQIGQWSGIPLKLFLQRIGADLNARYVNFTCFDDYNSAIDMPSALHPQTILALDFERAPLTPSWGAPMRLRLPIKLGFKNPKYIQAMEVTNTFTPGYWSKQGYDWYSGQ